MDQYFGQARFRAYSALGHEIASRLPENLGDVSDTSAAAGNVTPFN